MTSTYTDLGIELIKEDAWIIFCLIRHPDVIDDEVKIKFIEKLKYPMSAACIYLRSYHSLEIDNLLYSKFINELPRIKEEIESQEVLRDDKPRPEFAE